MSDPDSCDDLVSGRRSCRHLRLVSSDDDESSGSDSDDSLSEGGDESGPERSGDHAGSRAELEGSGSSAESDSSESESAEVCAICLSSFRGQEIGNPESCDHNFCLDHILEWAKNVSTCPVDRQPFTMVLVRSVPGGKITRRVAIEEKDMLEEPEDDPTYCEVCGQCDREDRLLLCDGCDGGYHLDCLQPPLLRVPEEEWYCTECTPSANTASLAAEVGITQDELISLLDEEQLDVSTIGGASGRVTRPLARTRLAERIRVRVPTRLSSTQILASSTTTTSRSRTSRSSANRSSSASGGRRKRRTAKRKTKKSTTKRSRSKRTSKRKKSRRKTGKRSTRTCRADSSSAHDVTRQHLRRLLAIRRLKPGQMAPPVMGARRVAGAGRPAGSSDGARERSLAARRHLAGIPSLSLFGTRDDLGPGAPLHENDYFGGSEDERPLAGGRDTLCLAAPVRAGLPGRPAVGLKSRLMPSLSSPASDSARGDDVLAQILSSQTLLLSQSRQMKIERDGRLSLVARPGCSSDSAALRTTAAAAVPDTATASPPRSAAGGGCEQPVLAASCQQQASAGEEARSGAAAGSAGDDIASSSSNSSSSSTSSSSGRATHGRDPDGKSRVKAPSPPLSPSSSPPARAEPTAAAADSRLHCNGTERRGDSSAATAAAVVTLPTSPSSGTDHSPSSCSQQAYADYYYSVQRQSPGVSPAPEPSPGRAAPLLGVEGVAEVTRGDDDEDDDMGLYSDIEPPASATSSRDEVVDDFDECDMDGPHVSGAGLSSHLTVAAGAVSATVAGSLTTSGSGGGAVDCLPYASDVSSDEDLVIDDSACNRSPTPAESPGPTPTIASRLTEVISSPEAFHEEEVRRCPDGRRSDRQLQQRPVYRTCHSSSAAANLPGTEQISDSEQPHDFDDGIEEGEIPSAPSTRQISQSLLPRSVAQSSRVADVSSEFGGHSSTGKDGDVEEGEISPPRLSPSSSPVAVGSSVADTGGSVPRTRLPLDSSTSDVRHAVMDEDDDGMIEDEVDERMSETSVVPLTTAHRSSSECSDRSVKMVQNSSSKIAEDDDAPAIDEEIAQFVISEKTHTVESIAGADDPATSDPTNAIVSWKKVTKSNKSRNYRDVARPSSNGDRSSVRASRLGDDDVRRVINSRRKRRKHSSRRSRSSSREQRSVRPRRSRSRSRSHRRRRASPPEGAPGRRRRGEKRRSRDRERHSVSDGGDRSPGLRRHRRKRSRRRPSASPARDARRSGSGHGRPRGAVSPSRQRRVWLSPVGDDNDVRPDVGGTESGCRSLHQPSSTSAATQSTPLATDSKTLRKKKKSTARDESKKRKESEDVSKAVVADGNNLLISLSFSRLAPSKSDTVVVRQKSGTPPAAPERAVRPLLPEKSVSPIRTEPDITCKSPDLPCVDAVTSRPTAASAIVSTVRPPRRSRRRHPSRSSSSSHSSTPPLRNRRLGGAGGALRRPRRLSPVDIDVIEVPASDHEPIIISDGSASSSDEVLPASPNSPPHRRLASPPPDHISVPSRGPHTPPEPCWAEDRPLSPSASRSEVRQALSRPPAAQAVTSDATIVKFTLNNRSSARALHTRVNPLLAEAEHETSPSSTALLVASPAASVSAALVPLPASVPDVPGTTAGVSAARGPSTPPEQLPPSVLAPSASAVADGSDAVTSDDNADDSVDTYDPFEPTRSPDTAMSTVNSAAGVVAASSPLPSSLPLSVATDRHHSAEDGRGSSPGAKTRADEVAFGLFADLPPPKVSVASSPHSTFPAAPAFSLPDTTRPPPALSPPPVNGLTTCFPSAGPPESSPAATDMELASPVSVDSPDSRDCDDLFEPPLEIALLPPQPSAPSPPALASCSRPAILPLPASSSATLRSRNKPLSSSTVSARDNFDALFSTDSLRTASVTKSGGSARERRSATTGGASSHAKRKSHANSSAAASRPAAKSTTAQLATAAARKTVSQQLDKLMASAGVIDGRVASGDDMPDSAVDMQVKEKYLKKLNRQERVVEEVKLVLKPYYHKRAVNKLQYKEILRKAVPKICHSKSGEINPNKIQALIVSYVRKYKHLNKKQQKLSASQTDPGTGGAVSAAEPSNLP